MNISQFIKPRLLPQHHAIVMNTTRSMSWFKKDKRQFFQISDKEEPKFFSDTQPNPLHDVEQRIEHSKKKLEWRPTVHHRPTVITEGLRLLAPERTKQFFETLRHPMDSGSLQATLEFKKRELMAIQQRFIADRHRICGNDLAAAHFLVARGGQVRFTKSKEWVKKNKYDEYDLPRTYDPEWVVDAIKCDGMELLYEGLENIRRLNHLRYFSVRDVKYFDDWCMDRLCSNQFDNIEILDVTGTIITANALYAVPKLRSLKAIVLDLTDRSIEFQLACSLLEEAMPNLKILNSADVHDDIHELQKQNNKNLPEST